MAYCGPRGIPYSHYLGGPRLWDDVSRAAALAWAERDADRCPSCGLHHRDIAAAAGGDLRRLPVKGDYQACPGCQAKEMTRPPDGEDERKWFHFRWRPRERLHPGPAAGSVGDETR